jgi:small redox-active disulfide protein 2
MHLGIEFAMPVSNNDPTCCKQNQPETTTMLTIKILGSGCANCKQLEQLTRKVLDQLAIEAAVVKVTDPNEYSDYGVMATPGLVIDEKTVCSGRVPSLKELDGFISSAATNSQ